MTPIKIFDIEVKNPKLINYSEIARQCGFSTAYVTKLLDENNVRKNETALRTIRNTIVDLYGDNVKIIEPEYA